MRDAEEKGQVKGTEEEGRIEDGEGRRERVRRRAVENCILVGRESKGRCLVLRDISLRSVLRRVKGTAYVCYPGVQLGKIVNAYPS